MQKTKGRIMRGAGIALTGAIAASVAQADVTVTEQVTVDALVTKINSTVVEHTTSDRQRKDTDGKMTGVIGWLAGSMRSGDIIRLDRNLEWHLDPDHKRYRETLFPTEAERAAYRAKMEEIAEKMKQCPAYQPQQVQQQQQSKCAPSEPKFDIQNTDETATIAGHPTRKSRLSMTYTCKDPSTGDSCDYVATSDVWLTDDAIPGFDERRAFEMAHLQKLGLDPASTRQMAQQMQAALAPYMDQLKQLSSKSSAMKGTPLRTVISMSMGGPTCAAAKQRSQGGTGGSTVGDATAQAQQAGSSQASSEAGSAANQAVGNSLNNTAAGRILGSAAGAFGSKLAGGLFSKKPESKPATQSATPASNASPGLVQLMSMSTEVQSVSTDPIPAALFELPSGYTKVVPQPGKEEEFTCPKAPDKSGG